MKRVIPILLLAVFAASALVQACVENNPSVVAVAVDYRYDQEVSCRNGKYMSSDTIYLEELTTGYRGSVVLENKMSQTLPYKGSGGSGSGSGSTIDVTPPDYNSIYVEKLALKCTEGACEGQTADYKTILHVTAGACANPGFTLPNDWVPAAAGESITVSIVVHYKDSGRLKNKTNEVFVMLTLSDKALCPDGQIFDPNESGLCKTKS
ncbi:MAG: hypothetical protein WC966_03885 [Bradymonadales bacterium]|jgi:hypothetical protein